MKPDVAYSIEITAWLNEIFILPSPSCMRLFFDNEFLSRQNDVINERAIIWIEWGERTAVHCAFNAGKNPMRDLPKSRANAIYEFT